jgi:hypothetical protein
MARRTHAARKTRVTSKAALGRYLAAGLGATGLATVESEAAVVSLDITNLGSNAVNASGINAGIASGGSKTVNDFVVAGRSLTVGNNLPLLAGNIYTGLWGNDNGVRIAATGGNYAEPTKFVFGNTVSSATSFQGARDSQVFYLKYGSSLYNSPNFTASPANYIGFRVAANGSAPQFNDATQFNYGYFQVTWDSSSDQFQILSGAYESTVNTPIAVPEPSTVALAGIGALALGAGAIRRSRKARKAVAEGTLAEAI